MKKIYYSDLMAVGGMHTEYNAACVRMLLLAFPEYRSVIFCSELSHCLIVKRKNNHLTDIIYSPYRLLLKSNFFKTGKGKIVRDLISTLYVLKIFLNSKSDDLLYFALAFPLGQYCIHFCRLFFRRKVFICQHGELEAFIDGNRLSRLIRRYYKSIRPLLKSKRILNVILGYPIYENVKKLFADKSLNVIIIDHPYIFEHEKSVERLQFTPLIIGQIGTGGLAKGTQNLFSLASLLRSEILEGKLVVKLVGCLAPKLSSMDEGLVSYSSQSLSDEEFNVEVDSLHFALQLRDMSTGKAIASGSFFDALKHEKPLIGFYNNYVDYYTKSYPMIEKEFDSIEIIAKEIQRLLKLRVVDLEKEYESAIKDICKLKRQLSLQNIANSFRMQYEEILLREQ